MLLVRGGMEVGLVDWMQSALSLQFSSYVHLTDQSCWPYDHCPSGIVEFLMPVLTLKVIASLLQMHGPGATIQSDHQGIDALLGDVRGRISEEGVVKDPSDKTEVAFRRGFARGGAGAGGFRRGGFVRV